MNSLSNERHRRRTITLIGSGAFLLMVGIFAVAYVQTRPVLDEKILTAKALEIAHHEGLQGNPTAQKAVMMTLDEWTALNNSGLGPDAGQVGLTPDMPVFVLALRGNVEYRGPYEPDPSQPAPTGPPHFAHITIALDARTGDFMGLATGPAGSPMPIPVP